MDLPTYTLADLLASLNLTGLHNPFLVLMLPITNKTTSCTSLKAPKNLNLSTTEPVLAGWPCKGVLERK